MSRFTERFENRVMAIHKTITPKRTWLNVFLIFWPPAWLRGLKRLWAWIVRHWSESTSQRALEHVRTKESWKTGFGRLASLFSFLGFLKHIASKNSWINGWVRTKSMFNRASYHVVSLRSWRRGLKRAVFAPFKTILWIVSLIIALIFAVIITIPKILKVLLPRRSWGMPITALVVVFVVAVSSLGVWGYNSGRLDVFSDTDDKIDYAFSPNDAAKLSESVRAVRVYWGDSATNQVLFIRDHTGVVTSAKEIVVSTSIANYQLTQQEVAALTAAIESGQLVIQGNITILGLAILPSTQDRVQKPEWIDMEVDPAVHSTLNLMSLRRGQAILDVTPAKMMAIEDEVQTGAKLMTVAMYEIPGTGVTEARVTQHIAQSAFNSFVFFSDAELGQPVFVLRDGEPELIGITSMSLDGMVVAANFNPHFAGFFQRLGIDVDVTRLQRN